MIVFGAMHKNLQKKANFSIKHQQHKIKECKFCDEKKSFQNYSISANGWCIMFEVKLVKFKMSLIANTDNKKS